jgi:hypothetical protein
MTDDIVTRLRLFNYPLEREAADEIERLRDELARNDDEFRETITELRQRVETLTVERDHARQLVCRHTKKSYHTLNRTAELRGWDCFKEPAHAS